MVQSVKDKLDAIPDKWLLFSLSIAALVMFGYNQNASMKEIALVCIGGLVGYLRPGEK